MNKTIVAAMASGMLLATAPSGIGQGTRHSFSFNAVNISGAPSGAVTLAGGGVYDIGSGFQQGGGAFHCTQDITQGPLAGLRAGEGVRWATVALVPSTGFKCGSDAGEPLKTATTDEDTVVLQAIFFRQADGNNPSFTAKVFVSASDEDPDAPGVQNVWIQGVGCAEATVNVR
ncbi:MAG TPA: hypothetical protein VL503_06440 [Candidatus Omnitrophota bacterium]|jgi:hypothetical protein|nr:hypothetical protein [Candidatus Omnitrophota bacterium]